MADTDGCTFKVTEYDPAIAEEGVRLMAAAMVPKEADSGEVGTAMATATAAFPGLQDFVSEMDDGKLVMDLSALEPAHGGPLLVAAASLAAVGAVAEVCEGFEWNEVEACGEECAAAVSAMDAAQAPSAGP